MFENELMELYRISSCLLVYSLRALPINLCPNKHIDIELQICQINDPLSSFTITFASNGIQSKAILSVCLGEIIVVTYIHICSVVTPNRIYNQITLMFYNIWLKYLLNDAVGY